jgi:hypothetical protein
MAIVLLRKTWNHTRPVLSQTPFQIVRHTDVQCCIALVCKNVYLVLMIHDLFLFFLSPTPLPNRKRLPTSRGARKNKTTFK